MRDIDEIYIHCADTPASMDIGSNTIRKWHTDPKSEGGRGWSDIGYHLVLRRNGIWEVGRPMEVKGAHVRKHNARSIGICVVGRGFNITPEQWVTLKVEIKQLHKKYPNAKIKGHNEADPNKPWCPGFDVQGWLKEERLI